MSSAHSVVMEAAENLTKRFGRLGILSRVVVSRQPSNEQIAQAVLDVVRGRLEDERLRQVTINIDNANAMSYALDVLDGKG